MTTELSRAVLDSVERRLKGKWPRLYKVRAWVNHRDVDKDHPYEYEEIFLVESTARLKYLVQENEIKSWEHIRTASGGAVEVFIPHVFEDGSLAYWPDDDEYISRYRWGTAGQ